MIEEIHSAERLDAIMRSEDRKLVAFFSSATCQPCKPLYADLLEISPDFPQARFLSVGIEYITDDLSPHVNQVPTVLVISKRQVIDKIVGPRTRPWLVKRFTDLLE